MAQAITTQAEGARIYVLGDTYAIRAALKSAGCHWDAERRAWWIGKKKRSAIESLVGSEEVQQATSQQQEQRSEAPGVDATVAGRVEYKGRTYYLAGRVVRGQTNWGDEVTVVESRDGSRVLLYFRDGSRQFWAATEAVRVIKRYERPQTIAGLREYAARAQAGGGGRLEDGYYYGRGGEVLASGCSECSRLGRMCSSCEHDQ